MTRRKNYRLAGERTEALKDKPRINHDESRNREDALIDISSLLGPNARLATGQLDLRGWLDRGIDDWVWSAVSCLKALLLSGGREVATVTHYRFSIGHFFSFLTSLPVETRPTTPPDLLPEHIDAFMHWLKQHAQAVGWKGGSSRAIFQGAKALLVEMFQLGFIAGEPTRFFPRVAFSWRSDGESRQTSLSDPEQLRLSAALKSDLSALHHGRLDLTPSHVQALRLLLISHRQGLNLTPLLELRRDSISPGLLPGTIVLKTNKFRNRRRNASVGRYDDKHDTQQTTAPIAFSLSEGAVIQQAIQSTEPLLDDAPHAMKNRVWLYRSHSWSNRGSVTCLDQHTLASAIDSMIKRHSLLGDDGEPLRVNLSRLRKSFFDRAFRIADGDLSTTANFMGNVPSVAGSSYPSMNEARKSDAAAFLSNDYLPSLRIGNTFDLERKNNRVIDIRVSNGTKGLTSTPVAACADPLGGQHAPHDGSNFCDRYVMCLFCSSFAVVGTTDELWRLFSFRQFAQKELEWLDSAFGPNAPTAVENLRDRYRLAIPYIGEFTKRQFSAKIVRQAIAKAEASLHPFWAHQMALSRRARIHTPGLTGDDP